LCKELLSNECVTKKILKTGEKHQQVLNNAIRAVGVARHCFGTARISDAVKASQEIIDAYKTRFAKEYLPDWKSK